MALITSDFATCSATSARWVPRSCTGSCRWRTARSRTRRRPRCAPSRTAPPCAAVGRTRRVQCVQLRLRPVRRDVAVRRPVADLEDALALPPAGAVVRLGVRADGHGRLPFARRRRELERRVLGWRRDSGAELEEVGLVRVAADRVVGAAARGPAVHRGRSSRAFTSPRHSSGCPLTLQRAGAVQQ